MIGWLVCKRHYSYHSCSCFSSARGIAAGPVQLREHPASRAAGDQREPQLRGGTHPQAPQLHADLPEAKTSRRHRRLFQNGSGVSVLHGHDASQPGRPEKNNFEIVNLLLQRGDTIQKVSGLVGMEG